MDLKSHMSNTANLTGEFELRRQRNLTQNITYVNGRETQNSAETVCGTSARVYKGGAWGFSALPGYSKEIIDAVFSRASSIADSLAPSQKGAKMRPALTPGESALNLPIKDVDPRLISDYLREIDAYIEKNYKESLLSRSVGFTGLEYEKCIAVPGGISSHSFLPRSTVTIYMTAQDQGGLPVKMRASFGGYGQFMDRFLNPADCFSGIDSAFSDLMKKREGVFCEAGEHVCIMDPNISGLFAHEAVGHTIEGDGILLGGILGSKVGKKVGSEKVTIADIANTFNGEICPIPVWADDEGVEAKDVIAIDKGILKGLLHSRETAAALDMDTTGNARAAFYSDEPLVRMRNTVIMPGPDKISDMIASVDKGYYFTDTEYGMSDTAGEFCFSVNMGYEIEKGKIKRAIRDTTISGIVFDVLNSVDMVANDFLWWTRGSCGKKQVIQTGMGGPSIKCKINVGGR